MAVSGSVGVFWVYSTTGPWLPQPGTRVCVLPCVRCAIHSLHWQCMRYTRTHSAVQYFGRSPRAGPHHSTRAGSISVGRRPASSTLLYTRRPAPPRRACHPTRPGQTPQWTRSTITKHPRPGCPQELLLSALRQANRRTPFTSHRGSHLLFPERTGTRDVRARSPSQLGVSRLASFPCCASATNTRKSVGGRQDRPPQDLPCRPDLALPGRTSR